MNANDLVSSDLMSQVMEMEARLCRYSINNKGDFLESNTVDLSGYYSRKTNADSRGQTQTGSLKSFIGQCHRRTFEALIVMRQYKSKVLWTKK